jgi:uncharacterized protein Yka (UPF0111/DUF47 family)
MHQDGNNIKAVQEFRAVADKVQKLTRDLETNTIVMPVERIHHVAQVLDTVASLGFQASFKLAVIDEEIQQMDLEVIEAMGGDDRGE